MDHSADEAGGEAIFSYDGLPSLAAPLPPPSAGGPVAVNNTNNDNEIGDALISTNNTFRTAFDSFNNAGTGWMGISHPTKNNATNISGSDGGGGWEDPRRKLYQLKSEIEQLETTFANEQQQQDKTVSDDIYNEEIQTEMEELKSRIVAMGLADDASLANMLRVRQEDLSRVIKDGLLSDGMENLSLQGKADDASKSTIVDSRKEAMLEERLRKLELVMGNSNNTSTTNNGDKSIMERIQTAENLLNEVSPTQIDKLAAKAKVIRADLEAAARAKTKLASKSSSAAAGQQNKEDAAIIAALHTQLLELQGLSSHLPALTLRLAELSNLHSNAADFSSRLTAAEVAVGRSEGMLHNVNEALSSMETGWKDNMDRVEGNVKRLDELLLANKK